MALSEVSFKRVVVKGLGILALLLFIYTDLALPKIIENSDYTTAFYVSGKLVLGGELGKIYCPANSLALSGMPYDQIAHQILPNLSVYLTAICHYFPLLILFCSPLSLLSPALALLSWQVLSVLTLWLSVFLLSKKDKPSTDSYFWNSLLFLPLLNCLFIGQSTVILSLLPLAIGYYFLQKERLFISGLVWSLSFFKPQFLPVATLSCFCLLLKGRWQAMFGLLSGLTGIFALNILLLGSQSIEQWISAMKVDEFVHSNPANGVVQHLLACLPRLLILMTPVADHSWAKPCIYGATFVFVIIATIALWRLSKKITNNIELSSIAMLTGLSLVPLISPHLFYYDLAAFILVFFLLKNSPLALQIKLQPVLIPAWIWLNAYGLLMIFATNFASPWLLLLPFFEFYRRLISGIWKLKQD